MMWKRDVPLSFQNFHNVNYKRQIIPSVSCTNCPSLDIIKQDRQQAIHPFSGTSKKVCTVMTFENLVEPDWIQIDCYAPLLSQVICATKSFDCSPINNSSEHFSKNHFKCISEQNSRYIYQSKTSYCLHGLVSLHRNCYQFLWHNAHTNLNRRCKEIQGKPHIFHQKDTFFYLLKSTALPDFTMYDGSDAMHVLQITYKKGLNKFKIETKNISKVHAEGLFICRAAKQTPTFGLNLYQSQSEGYKSSYYLFRTILDQANCTTECPGNTAMVNEMSSLARNICSKNDLARDKNCQQFWKIQPVPNNFSNKSHFLCKNQKRISNTQVNDLFADCGPEAEDEPILLSQLTDNKSYKCKHVFRFHAGKVIQNVTM